MSRLRAVSGDPPARILDNPGTVVVHGRDPAALAAFWSAAAGYVAAADGGPQVLVDPAGTGPDLRVETGTPAAGPRLALEVTGSGPFIRGQALVEAETARLVALGACVVGRADGDGYGVVLADPAGNEFRVG
ncbi:MAG TPA: VOC family protein [Mycobacteriales bacterium]